MGDFIEVQPFSAGYRLIQGATVYNLDGGEAIMDSEMLRHLRERFGEPVVGKIGKLHYQFKPRRSIPKFTAAVPNNDADELLIQR